MVNESTHLDTHIITNRSRVAHLVGEGMRDKDISAMLAYAHMRCDAHSHHVNVCTLCGKDYRTNGTTATCHPCRNRANAVRQRIRNNLGKGQAHVSS